MDTPQEVGNTDTSQEVGNTDTPPEAGNTDTPQEAGNTDTPQEAGNTDTAQEVGNTDTAQETGNTSIPIPYYWLGISFVLIAGLVLLSPVVQSVAGALDVLGCRAAGGVKAV